MKYLYKKIKSMRQLFKIDESEKKRILEMHENATKKNYLMEQGTGNCIANESQDKAKQLTNNNITEFCNSLRSNQDFGLGLYYYVPYEDAQGKKFIFFSVVNDELGYQELGGLKLTTNNKWFIQHDFSYTQNEINPRNLTPSSVFNIFNGLKNLASSKNLNPERFTEYLSNLVNINPWFKNALITYKNFLNTNSASTPEQKKILNDPFFSNLIPQQ